MIFTKLDFWKASAERAIKTAFQFVAVGWGVDQLDDRGVINAFQLDYRLALGLAAGGALASVVTSLASIPVGNAGPSLFGVEIVRPAPAQARTSIPIKLGGEDE